MTSYFSLRSWFVVVSIELWKNVVWKLIIIICPIFTMKNFQLTACSWTLWIYTEEWWEKTACRKFQMWDEKLQQFLDTPEPKKLWETLYYKTDIICHYSGFKFFVQQRLLTNKLTKTLQFYQSGFLCLILTWKTDGDRNQGFPSSKKFLPAFEKFLRRNNNGELTTETKVNPGDKRAATKFLLQ